jgi:hypothetical protein
VSPWVRRLIILAVLAVAGSLTVWAYNNGVTGSDEASLSKIEGVERLIPESGTSVPAQSQVGIDLAVGYDANLEINGKTISNVATKVGEDGLQKNLAIGLITYQPGPGHRIERLQQGQNCIIANVWSREIGPTSSKPQSWCFNAT